MNEPVLTVIGNIAGEVDLRYTPSGAAVAKFTVASTPRSKNRQTDQWEDGETIWFRVTCWRNEAENAAQCLGKGVRVVVHGRLKQSTWTTKEGEERKTLELMADDIGASVKFAEIEVKKVARGSEAAKPKVSDDPWQIPEEDPPF